MRSSKLRLVLRSIVLSLFVAVGYVLSVGPTVYLCVSQKLFPVSAIEVLYFPIWKAKANSKLISSTLDSYLAFFVQWPIVDFQDVPNRPNPPAIQEIPERNHSSLQDIPEKPFTLKE